MLFIHCKLIRQLNHLRRCWTFSRTTPSLKEYRKLSLNFLFSVGFLFSTKENYKSLSKFTLTKQQLIFNDIKNELNTTTKNNIFRTQKVFFNSVYNALNESTTTFLKYLFAGLLNDFKKCSKYYFFNNGNPPKKVFFRVLMLLKVFFNSVYHALNESMITFITS